MTTRTWDARNCRERAEVANRGKDLTGFSVEAVDGAVTGDEAPGSDAPTGDAFDPSA